MCIYQNYYANYSKAVCEQCVLTAQCMASSWEAQAVAAIANHSAQVNWSLGRLNGLGCNPILTDLRSLFKSVALRALAQGQGLACFWPWSHVSHISSSSLFPFVLTRFEKFLACIKEFGCYFTRSSSFLLWFLLISLHTFSFCGNEIGILQLCLVYRPWRLHLQVLPCPK